MNITTPTRVAEELHFSTHDGQRLFYRRCPALGAQRRGAVLMFHRGHEHSGRMAHLVDELHIPAEQVKVATGTQRELDGLDLNARDCPVRYIITVQALREGWDCPFAYVLCTVQSIRSATAVEQLLGRVLSHPIRN